MMKKSIAGAVFLGCFGLFGLLLGVNSALSQVIPATPSPPNATSTFFRFLSCYDITNARYIACAFFHEVKLKEPITDPDNNGGHNHFFPPHPVLNGTEQLQCLFCTDSNTDPTIVQGFTTADSTTTATILHPVPQVAGQIEVRSDITLPPGYVCVSGCSTFVVTLDVGVPRLTELKRTAADDPFVLTGVKNDHPLNHFGTDIATRKLRLIAQLYVKGANPSLAINDMSLPKGGMFDLCSTYNPADTCSAAPFGGHKEHRTGTDADIDIQGVPCLQDTDLLKAVIAAGASRKCESGGRKHVDLD